MSVLSQTFDVAASHGLQSAAKDMIRTGLAVFDNENQSRLRLKAHTEIVDLQERGLAVTTHDALDALYERKGLSCEGKSPIEFAKSSFGNTQWAIVVVRERLREKAGVGIGCPSKAWFESVSPQDFLPPTME